MADPVKEKVVGRGSLRARYKKCLDFKGLQAPIGAATVCRLSQKRASSDEEKWDIGP